MDKLCKLFKQIYNRTPSSLFKFTLSQESVYKTLISNGIKLLIVGVFMFPMSTVISLISFEGEIFDLQFQIQKTANIPFTLRKMISEPDAIELAKQYPDVAPTVAKYLQKEALKTSILNFIDKIRLFSFILFLFCLPLGLYGFAVDTQKKHLQDKPKKTFKRINHSNSTRILLNRRAHSRSNAPHV